MIWDLPWVILPTTWTLPNFCSAAMARMTHLSAVVAPAGKVVAAVAVAAGQRGRAGAVVAWRARSGRGRWFPPSRASWRRGRSPGQGQGGQVLAGSAGPWRRRREWQWRWGTTSDPVHAAPTQKIVLPAACEKRRSRARRCTRRAHTGVRPRMLCVGCAARVVRRGRDRNRGPDRADSTRSTRRRCGRRPCGTSPLPGETG